MTNKHWLILTILLTGLSAPVAKAANDFGVVQESLKVGKVLSLTLPSGNSFHLSSNSNPSIATAKVLNGSLMITGNSIGSSKIDACVDAANSSCLEVMVNVGGMGSVLGASTVTTHPTGSWIKDGPTIFYVSNQGLIPVTSWSIFLSNGGTKKTPLYPATAADLKLPLESFMVAGDKRVK